MSMYVLHVVGQDPAIKVLFLNCFVIVFINCIVTLTQFQCKIDTKYNTK